MAGAAHSDAYIAFRKALTVMRKDAGRSQAQLAKILEKPPSYVAKYELGERRLDVVETWSIINILGANPSSFLDLVLDPFSENSENSMPEEN